MDEDSAWGSSLIFLALLADAAFYVWYKMATENTF